MIGYPDLSADKPTRRFHTELYQELLEEASFLYGQRLTLLDDPEISWKDLAEFEERFEANIDALVVGEDLALDVCRTQVQEGDFGELHAAVRVFCRQGKGDDLAEAWRDLDAEDVDRGRAIRDALQDECPDAWQKSLNPAFLRGYLGLIPVLAPVIGYRRFASETALLHALSKAPAAVLPPIIWALGRIGKEATPAALMPFLDHPDQLVQRAAAESLLRFGKYDVVNRCLRLASFENWPATTLALGGGNQASQVLLGRAQKGVIDAEGLLALGVLGDLATVKTLYEHLGNKDLARSATMGLFLITGAEIYEEVFVPEEIDEDELFEEELAAYRKDGSVPTKADGQPFGENIRRLSQNPSDWQTWLQENQNRFQKGSRYRMGKPYDPSTLLDTLLCGSTPYRCRQLAIEELKIRYGADFPIEADMPVRQQETILPRIEQWVQTTQGRFQAGQWYFDGRLLGS